MNQSEFKNILKSKFIYQPTAGQEMLMNNLANYIFEDEDWSVFVLKGYAGTGKTSIISAMVKTVPAIKKKSVLLAPTGRAAKVLASYSGQRAATIHRRIYFQTRAKDGSMLLRLQKNLYRDTVFLVDEASMIPGETLDQANLFRSRNLLDDLIEYVYSGKNCKLVLIGDSAQLPPVGTSISPALDLSFLKSRYELKIWFFELKEVMRQALESGILSNATALRTKLSETVIKQPFFNLNGQSDIEVIQGEYLEDALNSTYASDMLDHTIIVTRSNKRANIFNQEIRKRILFRENEIEAGDYLMIVKNNYFWLPEDSQAGFIANGDIVELLRIRRIEELYGFRFAEVTIRLLDYPDDEPVDVKIILDTIMVESASLSHEDNNKLFQSVMEVYSDIPQRRDRVEKVKANPHFNALQVKFAYAMTCHKSQGGQWENVFIDQGYLRNDMIDHEYLRWLYTALTRGTKKVFMIGFNDKFFTPSEYPE